MNTPCAIVPFAHLIDSIVQAPQRTASFIHGLAYHQIDALTLIARQGRITQPQLAIAQAYCTMASTRATRCASLPSAVAPAAVTAAITTVSATLNKWPNAASRSPNCQSW